MVQSNYIVLSRKYRPKNLDELLGQSVLSESLKAIFDNKKVPHAFLFSGMRGVGKTTTARIFARCVNCLGVDLKNDMTSTPCGVCRSCLAMDKDQHLDVMEFDAASRTGVDDIREIIDACQYMPVLGRYKIFIIDEVHMLSKSAFNALLKTLEEPPSHVKFVFATTEKNKIPETIHSRCMTFQLQPVLFNTISSHMQSICSKENFTIEKDASEILAKESDGSVRDAISMLEQAMMLVEKKRIITKEIILKMLGGVGEADIQFLLDLILSAKTKKAVETLIIYLKNGAEPNFIYKNLQGMLYHTIVNKVLDVIDVKYSLHNLLYIWQIYLKQLENFKFATYSEQVLIATIILLAETAALPDIEKLMLEEQGDKAQKIIDNVMEKFQNSILTELE